MDRWEFISDPKYEDFDRSSDASDVDDGSWMFMLHDSVENDWPEDYFISWKLVDASTLACHLHYQQEMAGSSQTMLVTERDVAEAEQEMPDCEKDTNSPNQAPNEHTIERGHQIDTHEPLIIAVTAYDTPVSDPRSPVLGGRPHTPPPSKTTNQQNQDSQAWAMVSTNAAAVFATIV